MQGTGTHAATGTAPGARRVRVALLCDVDQTVYHVGDEAIGIAGRRALAERGLEVVMISRHEKYGPGGRAPLRSIPALTFPWGEEDRTRYLGEIRDVLAGRRDALPPEDKLFGIIEQLRGVDALVIGGGGALTSRYGWLLAERVATALVAASVGARVILSGQSLGPALSASDIALVGELLDLCEVVGLRDADSVALARSIRPDHPALVRTVDDAVALDGLGDPADGADGAREETISVTLGSDPDPLPEDDAVAVAAAVIDGLADRTGCAVELVPHMADPDAHLADPAMHERVAAALRAPSTALPIELAEASARRTTRARFVVSTRFHPVVFGLLGGAGTLALPLNRYGAARIDGALANAGWTRASVPLAALWDPETGGPDTARVDAVLDELVASEAAERAHLARARAALRERSRAWWDVVAAAAAGDGIDAEALTRADELPEPVVRQGEEVRALLAPWVPAAQAERSGPASVAVVMRTQDRPTLLERAVQDVLAQTRADWELVIVDDAGRGDGVAQVVRRHEHEAHGRVTVLRREESAGMEAASNAGVAATSAPLIAVHDDDDTWQGSFLQRMVARLAARPEEIAAVARTVVIRERILGDVIVEDHRFLSWPELHGARLLDYMTVNRTTPIAVVHRRRAHDEIGPFREDLPVIGDYDFHLRLLAHAPVGFVDVPLAHWHQRPWADGRDSNSLFALGDAHRDVDRAYADEHFGRWVASNGIGLPMFIARSLGDQLDRRAETAGPTAVERELLERLTEVSDQLEATGRRLEELEAAVARSGLVSDAVRTARRSVGWARRRVRGGRE